MNEKKRKLVGFCLLIVALVVFLMKNNEIKQEERMYDYHILVQTGRILTDEFGFQIPVGDFDLMKNPEQAVGLPENEWRLQGNTVSKRKKSTIPWEARVRWVHGAKEAMLLKVELDGEEFYPTATESNLVFGTNYKLNLTPPKFPSR